MDQRRPRRPAMLEPKEAEEIVGDQDPAAESEVAHTSAWALLGVRSGDFDREAVSRLITTVRREGADVVAYLWARSPEFTLPGALWRIYLLWQWNQTNPDVLEERYREGVAALRDRGETDPDSLPDLKETLRGVEGVLAGYATDDDLAPVFEGVSQVMRVMAAGVSHGARWITEDSHSLAYPVTRRPQALLDTARELEESARQAWQGTLE